MTVLESRPVVGARIQDPENSILDHSWQGGRKGGIDQDSCHGASHSTFSFQGCPVISAAMSSLAVRFCGSSWELASHRGRLVEYCISLAGFQSCETGRSPVNDVILNDAQTKLVVFRNSAERIYSASLDRLDSSVFESISNRTPTLASSK